MYYIYRPAIYQPVFGEQSRTKLKAKSCRIYLGPCADPEGGGGQGVWTPPPSEKSQNIGFSNRSGSPQKSQLPSQHPMCAVIGTPAKRHLMMAFRWRADDGPLIVVLGSCLPSSTEKNVVEVGPL